MDIMDFSVQRNFSLMNISLASVNKEGCDMFGRGFFWLLAINFTSIYMGRQEGSKNPPPRALTLVHLLSTLNEPCRVVRPQEVAPAQDHDALCRNASAGVAFLPRRRVTSPLSLA